MLLTSSPPLVWMRLKRMKALIVVLASMKDLIWWVKLELKTRGLLCFTFDSWALSTGTLHEIFAEFEGLKVGSSRKCWFSSWWKEIVFRFWIKNRPVAANPTQKRQHNTRICLSWRDFENSRLIVCRSQSLRWMPSVLLISFCLLLLFLTFSRG